MQKLVKIHQKNRSFGKQIMCFYNFWFSFTVLKMMVGNNLKDTQLQQIVDKTIVYADKDGDGKI